VAEAIVRPAGRVGETVKFRGAVPPAAVTGVKAVAAWFSVRVVVATAVVAERLLLTVRLKVAVAVALLASVTVTVKVVAERATVGVPEI
jgi:O-antigen ligase